MKKVFFLILFLIHLCLFSQEINTQFRVKKDLVADKFIGVDDFKNLYYLRDNILFKKTSTKEFSYSNINLGELTSVQIQNPFKLVLFYADFNSTVILDNNLNELTERIDFTKETLFNNVNYVTGASQNNLWLFPDDNKLHLYDYQNNSEVLQTQAMTFYDENFVPVNMVSSYKKVWIQSKKGVLEFNEYGVFLKNYPLEEIDFIFPFQKGFIYSIDKSLYYHDLIKATPVLLDHKLLDQSVYINNSNIFIFESNLVYEYQIMR